MQVPFSICIMSCLMHIGKCEMVPYIVGGNHSDIPDNPHVASLAIKCVSGKDVSYWSCGSSIINQKLLMTAAHCTGNCDHGSHITATVGHQHRKKGSIHSAYSYLNHEYYNEGTVRNDISLVRLKHSLTFTSSVSRVAVVEHPSYEEKARIAGWGLVSEKPEKHGHELKVVDQYVWKENDCVKLLISIPRGTLCASSGNEDDYPSVGDSGSALIIRGYVQIGIVSFKKPMITRSVIVYSDTGYFYSWIVENTEYILCDGEKSVIL